MTVLDHYWNIITSYMNDDIRNDLHNELAPCTNSEFYIAYLAKDPEFEIFVLDTWGYVFTEYKEV